MNKIKIIKNKIKTFDNLLFKIKQLNEINKLEFRVLNLIKLIIFFVNFSKK